VAFRVSHDDPVFPVLLERAQWGGSRPPQAIHLGIDSCAPLLDSDMPATADVEVEVDAILDDLGFRHPLEVDTWSTPLGVDDRTCRVPLIFGNPLCRQVGGPGSVPCRWVLLAIA